MNQNMIAVALTVINTINSDGVWQERSFHGYKCENEALCM